MARPLGEIARRGVDNVLANWPLLLIRIAEGVAMMATILGIVVLAIVPVAAAAVGSLTEVLDTLGRTGDLEELLLGVAPLLVVYILLVVSFVLLLAMLVHSFVQGGIVGCYVEAERRSPGAGAQRDAFRVFTPELWWREGKRNVWRFFWIYNVIWGAYSLLLLLPLLPLVVLVALFPENPVSIVIAIVGFVAVVLFAIGVAFVVLIWSQVVLIDAARRDLGPVEAINASGEALRGRLLNIILIGGIFFALSTTAGGLVAGATFSFDAAGAIPGFALALIPLQILLSLINSAISTLFGSWLLAALAAALAAPAEVRHDVVAST